AMASGSGRADTRGPPTRSASLSPPPPSPAGFPPSVSGYISADGPEGSGEDAVCGGVGDGTSIAFTPAMDGDKGETGVVTTSLVMNRASHSASASSSDVTSTPTVVIASASRKVISIPTGLSKITENSANRLDLRLVRLNVAAGEAEVNGAKDLICGID